MLLQGNASSELSASAAATRRHASAAHAARAGAAGGVGRGERRYRGRRAAGADDAHVAVVHLVFASIMSLLILLFKDKTQCKGISLTSFLQIHSVKSLFFFSENLFKIGNYI